MKSSNLAERFEEFDAVLDSLRLTTEPTARMDVRMEANAAVEVPAHRRRVSRRGGIVDREQGLRPFRVC